MALQPLDFQTKQHTLGHVDCPVCNEANRMLYQSLTCVSTFAEAFKLWIDRRTLEGTNHALVDVSYLSEKTITDYRTNAKALGKFFGHLRLEQIHPGHLMEYQNARARCDRSVAKWARPAGANCIRKEIALLIRILTQVGMWKEEQDEALLRLRATESDVPRAMTPEEQHRFLHLASSREEWRFIYCYTIVALHTTCSTKELRCLLIGDVFTGPDAVLHIRKKSAKNRYRVRTIPLTSPEVIWALDWLIERARSLGGGAMHHYLFPIQDVPGTYDPTRPMSDSGVKKRFSEIRHAARVPWLKPNGLRHTAITRLAEAGTPIHVILAIAGHVTFRMQQHYIAVSMSAKRSWVGAAWPGEQQPPTQVEQRVELTPVEHKKPPVSVRPVQSDSLSDLRLAEASGSPSQRPWGMTNWTR